MGQDLDLLLMVGGVSGKMMANATIKQRTWSHICWVHGKGEESIHVGGQVLSINSIWDKVAFSTTSKVHDAALIIGQSPNTIREGLSISTIFQGYLAEFNIWDREFTKDEVNALRTCQEFPHGNIVAWKEYNFNIFGNNRNIDIKNIDDMAIFCKEKSFFVFSNHIDLLTAHKQCQAMGGEIAAPNGEEENQEIRELVRTFDSCLRNPDSIAWIGIEKNPSYPQWIFVNAVDQSAVHGYVYSHSQRNASNFSKINPSKMAAVQSNEDYCVTMTDTGDWNIYRDCYSPTNAILACNVCQFRTTPSFTLKGSCPRNGPDWMYYLTQDRGNPFGYFFEGYMRDTIVPGNGDRWHLNSKYGENLITLQPYTEGRCMHVGY